VDDFESKKIYNSLLTKNNTIFLILEVLYFNLIDNLVIFIIFV
jgi:hypothetical protein